jgi:hypothetical protein
MRGGNRARVDRVNHRARRAHAFEQRFDFDRVRRKTPVETHHQQRTGAGQGLFNLVSLIERQTERLFDKHMFARGERGDGLPRVRMMARRDKHGVDVGIVQHGRGVGGRIFKFKFFGGARGGDARAGNNGLAPNGPCRGERGQ